MGRRFLSLDVLSIISTLLLASLLSPEVAGDSPPMLPRLPNDPLQINVEATIYRTNITSGVTTGYTAFYEEYRDSVNNRGLTVQISNSMETRYYYDLTAKQGFAVQRDISSTPLYQADCTTTNLNADSQLFGGFQVTKKNGHMVISNVSEFFQWSSDRNPTFQGNATVRGIFATKWMILVRDQQGSDKKNYELTYYFNYNHSMPYYGTDPVPLRLEMSGITDTSKGNHTFYHVYDFNLVAPLGAKDDSFFATPKGVYCPDRVAPASSTRTFADQYSIREEMLNPITKTVANSKAYFDYNLNMTRTDYQFENDNVYGYSNIKIVHDFAFNYEMVVNKDNGSCRVTRIPPNGMTSWDVTTDSDGKIMLIHTKDLQFNKDASYQGRRIEKGIPVDVWSTKESFDNGTVKIQESWYTNPSWKIWATQTLSSSYSVWAGFYYLTYDKGTKRLVANMQSNVFDQYHGPLQADGNLTTDVFDVSECYKLDPISTEHLWFNVLDSEQLFAQKKITIDSLIRAVRAHVSSLASVAPSRVTNIEVYEISPKSPTIIRIYFVLRAKLTLSDAPLSELIKQESDNAQAVTLLETQIATQPGVTFPVVAIDGHKSTLIISSLLTNDDGDVGKEIAGKNNDDTKPLKTYTPAAMAGLGIGMLLLGALLTVGFGAILWIKKYDISLPYLTQSNE